MRVDGPITLVDHEKNEYGFLKPVVLDGTNATLLRNNRIQGNPQNGVPPMNSSTCDNIFGNAYKAISLFASPTHDKERNLSKILAVGKVQSGKTAFFISTIALAFDNGYRLAFVVGGTKDPLCKQNLDRLQEEFSNNENVDVVAFKYADVADIKQRLEKGKNVVLVVLKNPAKSKNLGALNCVAQLLKDVPTVIIDDEGDEFSPGAPKSKARDNKTHRFLSEIIYAPHTCTFLSVTATPQANLLISTGDSLSPDYCVMVQPGKGYIGGIDFHDTLKNPHVEIVDDADDFKTTIPRSFESALRFFIMACCIKLASGDNGDFSMLVNPSSFTIIHSDIVGKILNKIRTITGLLSPDCLGSNDEMLQMEAEYRNYVRMNPSVEVSADEALYYLDSVVSRIETYEFNATRSGKEDQERAEKDSDKKYKIYVGGSMLGRGLTIKRLIVTYIYNDSKTSAVDTLYQRARWLGYKASYFDVCRIYLTLNLQQKFIDIVNSEIDMWDSISSFLDTKIELKRWPRVFSLSNDKLILTRTTVSHTITIERVNPGYTYDKTIFLSQEERSANRELANQYRESHPEGTEQRFSDSDTQTAFVVKTTVTEFIDHFISGYSFPRGATLGPKIFEKLRSQVEEGKLPNELYVIYLRYKTGEKRTGICDDHAIAELPQGRDPGTGYRGDRDLDFFSKELHVQIHMVYTQKGQGLSDAFPVLALNNPISARMIRMVTGDNAYE